jgi:hypothetical protein
MTRLYRPWRYRSGPSIEGNPRPTCLLDFVRDQRRASCDDRAGARFPRRGRTRPAARLPAGLHQGRARPTYRFPLRPRDARGALRPRPQGVDELPVGFQAPRSWHLVSETACRQAEAPGLSLLPEVSAPRARWLRRSLGNASCDARTALLGSRPGTGNPSRRRPQATSSLSGLSERPTARRHRA